MEMQFVGLDGRVSITTSGFTLGIVPGTPDVAQCQEIQGLASYSGKDSVTNERVLSISIPMTIINDQVVGSLRFVTSLRQTDRLVLMYAGIIVIVGIFVILVVVITNLLFIHNIVQPVKEINEVSKRIANGNYGVTIDEAYHDEIGELVENINHMSKEILKADKIKTDFLSSVSHELRTPLTAIAGWGETLINSDLSNTTQVRDGVRIMLKEASRLRNLVEELLDFSRIETNRMSLYCESMDVREEMDEVIFMMSENLQKEGIELNYTSADDLPWIEGDRARLKQVFFNLIDNAAKHGGSGKRIDVSLYQENQYVCIKIRDYGKGISAAELPLIRQRFYKGASKVRGSGIGMTVADEIIRMHSGVLDITSEVGSGTVIYIRLLAQ
jgi:signal transduction histidine kinase